MSISHDKIHIIYSLIMDKNMPCGWLLPNGQLNACLCNEHEEKAFEYLNLDNSLYQEFSNWLCVVDIGYASDFLVTEKGWILMHNPAQREQLIVQLNSRKCSKAQQNFLMDHYLKIGDTRCLLQLSKLIA